MTVLSAAFFPAMMFFPALTFRPAFPLLLAFARFPAMLPTARATPVTIPFGSLNGR
jgi:hypothetical protein